MSSHAKSPETSDNRNPSKREKSKGTKNSGFKLPFFNRKVHKGDMKSDQKSNTSDEPNMRRRTSSVGHGEGEQFGGRKKSGFLVAPQRGVPGIEPESQSAPVN